MLVIVLMLLDLNHKQGRMSKTIGGEAKRNIC